MNVYILSTCFTFFTFKTFSTFTISFQTVYVFGRTVSYMFPLRETLLVKNFPPPSVKFVVAAGAYSWCPQTRRTCWKFTVVILCAQPTRNLSATAKFLVRLWSKWVLASAYNYRKLQKVPKYTENLPKTTENWH